MLIILFLSHRRFIVVGHHLRLGWRVGIFFFLSRTKPKNKEKRKKKLHTETKIACSPPISLPPKNNRTGTGEVSDCARRRTIAGGEQESLLAYRMFVPVQKKVLLMLLLLLPCDKLQKENRKNRQRDSFLVYLFSVTVEMKIAPDAIVTGLQQDRKRKKKKEYTHTELACV